MSNEPKLSEKQKEVVKAMREGFIISMHTPSGHVFDNDRSQIVCPHRWEDIEVLKAFEIIKVEKVVRTFVHEYSLTDLGKQIKL